MMSFTSVQQPGLCRERVRQRARSSVTKPELSGACDRFTLQSRAVRPSAAGPHCLLLQLPLLPPPSRYRRRFPAEHTLPPPKEVLPSPIDLAILHTYTS